MRLNTYYIGGFNGVTYTQESIVPRPLDGVVTGEIGSLSAGFAAFDSGFRVLREKRCRGAYPLLIFVVVDPHHFAASQAHQRERRGQPAGIGPEVENSDLGLGGPAGSFNGVLKAHPLLQQELFSLFAGNSLKLSLRGFKLNPF